MRFILHFPQSKMDSLACLSCQTSDRHFALRCKFDVGVTDIIRKNKVVMLFIVFNF